MCREKLFSDVLDITAFLDYKDINTNRLQTLHFSKGVSPCFWSKIGHFFDFFFLGKIGRENLFGNVLDIIIAPLNYKKHQYKKVGKFPFFQRG